MTYPWLRSVVSACLILYLAVSCSSARRNVSVHEQEQLLQRGEVIVDIGKRPGCDTRVGKVIGVIDAPCETVWKVISDYNGHKEFMPGLIECFVIRPEALDLLEGASPEDLSKLEAQLREYRCEESPGEIVYTYGIGDFPWPLPDKRYVLRIERDEDRFTAHANMVIGEMKVNESSWELQPYGSSDSKTLAAYSVCLDPGMAVPGFAVNMAANSTLPGVIEAVRRKVKDPEYGL